MIFFFFQAEDGIRDFHVTGVQTCALPISRRRRWCGWPGWRRRRARRAAPRGPAAPASWEAPRSVRGGLDGLEREGLVLVTGVDPVLELDDAHLLEADRKSGV